MVTCLSIMLLDVALCVCVYVCVCVCVCYEEVVGQTEGKIPTFADNFL